jgi:hypothetical protein
MVERPPGGQPRPEGMPTIQPPGRMPQPTDPPRANVGETYAGPAPQAGGGGASSETPGARRYQIDPRFYQMIKQRDPVIAGWIDNAARMFGVSPERLAFHKYKESGFNRVSARGGSGEIGIMQFMPGTWKMVDPRGELNPANGQDAMYLAAKYINQLDYGPRALGRDSPASVAAYNGAGPAARRYAQDAFGGAQLSDRDFHTGGSRTTPQGVMQAASQGPDAVLRYMVQTAPNTMPMSDKWRHVESLMVQAAIRSGNFEGAAKARDLVASMAFTGTNEHLKAAYNALGAGQGEVAAQHLAAAHAFFPDGTTGQFWSDGRNVYAKRQDEENPDASHGAAPLTQEAVAQLFNQTKDPAQFLETLTKQRESVAKTRQSNAAADWNAARPGIEIMKDQTRQQIAGENIASREKEGGLNRENRADIAVYNQGEATNRAFTSNMNQQQIADKRAAASGAKPNPVAEQMKVSMYGTEGIEDPEARDVRARGASVFGALVDARYDPQVAAMLEQGLRIPKGAKQGLYRAEKSNGGQVRVLDNKTGQVVAIIPAGAAAALTGPLGAQPGRPASGAAGPPVLYTPRGMVTVPTALPQGGAALRPQQPGQAQPQAQPTMQPNPYAQPQQGALGYGVTPVYSPPPAGAGRSYLPPDDSDEDDD